MKKINRKRMLWPTAVYLFITGIIVLFLVILILLPDLETSGYPKELTVLTTIVFNFVVGMGFLPFSRMNKLRSLNSDELREMEAGDVLKYYYELEDTYLYADVEIADTFDPSKREVEVKILTILDKDLDNPAQSGNLIPARVGTLYID